MNLDDTREHIHLHTSEKKLQWWGYGEWVEEADKIRWEYRGIECLITRTFLHESAEYDLAFGGHLCGYISLPLDHPWASKEWDDIDCDVHGGITFSQESDGWRQIGFDCAHFRDLVPSMHLVDRENRADFSAKHPGAAALRDLFREMSPDTYKNVAFVIKQCESLVDQALEVYAPKPTNS
jgi:hypothetical protein